jgi:membrane associated rhomboid family serine protease
MAPTAAPHDPRADRGRLVGAALAVTAFTGALWWIRVLDEGLGWQLGALGVRPGEPAGLLGVLTAPLVHGSFEHLAANTPALLVLGTLLLYGYPRSRAPALALVWLGSGLGVWLIGRDSAHIGASGITHGLMFYLFLAGMVRRDRLAVAFSMIAFFLYGGMVWGVFPQEAGVSWEYHLCGALAGALAAFLFGRLDPRPAEKRYAWEDEAEDAEDPVIGDQWRWRRAPPRPERAARSAEFPLAGDDIEEYGTGPHPDDPLDEAPPRAFDRAHDLEPDAPLPRTSANDETEPRR